MALLVIGLYLLATKHPPRFNRWIAVGAVCICGTNSLFTLANKLTTAAKDYIPGTRVRHARYGPGLLLTREGDRMDMRSRFRSPPCRRPRDRGVTLPPTDGTVG